MEALTDQLRVVLEAIEGQPVLSICLFVGIHVAFAALLVPCSPLTALAGLLWGLWGGLAVSIASAFCSIAVTFFLAGWKGQALLARHFPRAWDAAVVRRVRSAVDRLGWRAVFLLLINPLIPGSSSGYLFGLCGVSPRQMLLGTLAGLIPTQTAMVAIGSLSGQAILGEARLVAGLAAAALLAAVVAFSILRKRLKSTGLP